MIYLKKAAAQIAPPPYSFPTLCADLAAENALYPLGHVQPAKRIKLAK